MSATVIIQRLTGAGPTSTDITSINTRANSYDTHSTADTTNPITIPASSSNYSYWVVTRLNCTVTPATAINNLKWYSDGTNSMGTGVTCVGNTASGYVQATGTAGTTGDVLSTGNYGTLAGSPTNVFANTSGSPLAVTGSISNPSTGAFGDRFVYQIVVASTAGAGATTAETFTWRYDES